MKSMGGLRFVSELWMTQPSSVNVPVVTISARTSEAVLRTALESGVDEYLPKPVNLIALFTVLAHATVRMGLEQISLAPSAPAHP